MELEFNPKSFSEVNPIIPNFAPNFLELQITDLEAERAVIGGLLLSNDRNTIAVVKEFISSAEEFVDTTCRIAYKAMLAVDKANSPINIMVILQCLEDNGLLNKDLTQESVCKLADTTVSAVNIDVSAQRVHEFYIRRLYLHAAPTIRDLAVNKAIELKSVADQIEKIIFDIREKAEKNSLDDGEYIGEIAYRVLEEAGCEKSGGGLSTGHSDLDQVTAGLPPELIFIAALPNVGKTHVLIDLARRVSILSSDPVPSLFLTGEMSKEQQATRIISGVTAGIKDGFSDKDTGVTTNRIRKGGTELDDSDWQKLAIALGDVSDKRLKIAPLPNSVDDIPRLIRKVKSENDGKIGAVFIDYLQLFGRDGTKGENRVQQLAYITRQLKKIQTEYNVPIIVASQLSRTIESRADKHPNLSDLHGSSSIEQDGDQVWFIYREEYHYKEKAVEKGIAEIWIGKNRNNLVPNKPVRFYFDPQFSRLRQAQQTQTA